MNANDVTLIIDSLCEKLALGAQNVGQLVPQLAQYKISIDITMLVLALLAAIVSVFAIIVSFKCRDDKSVFHALYLSDWDASFGALGSVFLISSIIMVAVNVVDVVGWISAPDLKAILYIIARLK